MTEAIRCPEPDCEGVIEDGYCTITGLAYRPPGPAAAAADRPAAWAPVDGGVTGARPASGASPASHGIAVSHGTAGSASSGATASRRSRRGSASHSAPDRLGAGLVRMPEIDLPDPTSLVLADPQIPQRRRVCARCGEPVGRSRGGQPALAEGFCAGCGQPYSFRPALRPGDRVGQYEIAGALAHGGQGWIYLARDHGVGGDFWVVFKGLLDSGDRHAQAAAIAERRFLAAVDHPAIVKIYTFVEHAGTGYIVMEYVGGTSMREVLRRRRAAAGRPDPLPAAEAVAYLLAVLPAFAYLHRNGLVFCDFKPDNMMVGRDAVRLIDLGAVRRIDDHDGAVYGTLGYQAPEVPTEGPSVASDLYTVGRTLATLVLDFRGNTSTYRHALPPASGHPVLARHESLYRLLVKATALDPDHRFTSAEEMHGELLGVLREIVAAERGTPMPARSVRFTGDAHPTGEPADPVPSGLLPALLPALLPDPDDPAATALAALPDVSPGQLAELLDAMGADSAGARLRLADLRTRLGEHDAARELLDAVAAEDPFAWRVHWQRGLLLLTQGDTAGAVTAFERVYGEVPGELAPKLALARAAEAGGNLPRAQELYDLVSRTDDTFTSAAFGLARVRLAAGDRDGAAQAYRRVPAASAAHVEARVRLARVLGTVTAAGAPDQAGLRAASTILDDLDLDPAGRATLTRDLLAGALDLVSTGAMAADPQVTIAGSALRPAALRLGLERAYRTLARLAATPDERYALVDLANSVRPRTLM
ncbi:MULTISPECIES: serine/threonine-protein kinase [Frankia]|uniref:non-specific serine/threonine protein kinase n=2 Tax=Frankia TaxID=1854 RepID=Q0RIX7_FRAAA|nr:MULTISPECIES: serine/threonine-protein kinase [Frankia]CAJ62538.1 putative serine/threonine-protein kinase [Frankia alni ACN14a]